MSDLNKIYFLTVLEELEIQDQGAGGVGFTLPGLQMAALLLPLHTIFSLGTHTSLVSFSSSHKDTGHIGLEPHPNGLILT